MKTNWFAGSMMAVVLTLAGVAAAEDVYRWTDEQGRIHYSNVPGRTPKRAAPVRGDVGYIAGALELVETEAVPAEEATGPALAPASRLAAERRLRRQIADIDAFLDRVRAAQRARLEAFSNHTLLADWQVADRAMELRQERARLEAELAALQQRDARAGADGAGG